ncbi:phospho-sugar mutase [Sporosarcina thermotolerans]|uniref:Phosphoglucomutase n=1 Tax=Sporosarcina thermotolerans TaxID=633404 RepID=A0AAW9A4R7_9BACL|nr:phospho-sugar mutase [Sporosarcina thermotolerans]MDW0116311.1 phospho-sugar mutase [Sporosarcina thermotolerans]
MTWRTSLDQWLSQLTDEDLVKQDIYNMTDEKQLEDCFYKELEFGTGGMRGIIGPGTNRINIYTVRKVAFGLSQYIKEQGEEAMARGIAIAYDSRHMSKEFALEVAKTVGGEGIQVYLFEDLRPTPLLSFAVRYMYAFAGVMITASHNPPEYNGLKVYGQDGAQLPPEDADVVLGFMKSAGTRLITEVAGERELLANRILVYIGEKIDMAYKQALQAIQLNEEKPERDLSIIFTPLHGTGNIPVREGLENFGFTNVTVVKEQENPDPNFSTVKSPNPEESAAFEIAIEYGLRVDADVLLATDPDADRLGVAVKNDSGEYVVLTGNQIGALMLHFLLEQKEKNGWLPRNGVVMKTIVTSELGRAIASSFGVETIDTLTGFKFIAEKINEFEETKEKSFLFGYEESYGYLLGNFVRDKDSVQSAVFVAEVAAYYKSQGKSLYDGLQELYKKFGYYKEITCSITLEGKDGAEQIDAIVEGFRNEQPSALNDISVTNVEDYAKNESLDILSGTKTSLDLPISNVLKYKLEDGSWVCIRPSGTEPKCKFYFAVKGESVEDANIKLAALQDVVLHGVKS